MQHNPTMAKITTSLPQNQLANIYGMAFVFDWVNSTRWPSGRITSHHSQDPNASIAYVQHTHEAALSVLGNLCNIFFNLYCIGSAYLPFFDSIPSDSETK
jgi:hypothetical protein